MMRVVLCFFLAMASLEVLPLLPAAHAQPAPPDKAKIKQAKSYVDAGLAAQSGGDYDTAIIFYSKAYELVPHPVLLFNIAQAHRLAGHVDQAVKLYQKFLATNPIGAEAQIARDLLAEIAKRRAEQTRRVEQATKARKDGRFEDARVELEAAYALDPQPDLLYAIGQVYAKLGNCGEAIMYYKRFVAAQKDPQVTKVVDQEIAACKSVPNPVKEPPQAPDSPRQAPAKSPPPPDRSPPPTADRPAQSSVDEPALPLDEQSPVKPPPQLLVRTKSAPAPVIARQSSPWYKDKLGDALVLGGIAATVVALVEYGSALSDIDTARTAHDLGNVLDLVDRAHSKRTISVVFVGAGGALITAGVVHYVFHSGSTDFHTVGVAPALAGGVVTYGGRF